MKILFLRLLLALCLSGLIGSVRGEAMPDALKGRLVALKGKSALPYDAPDLAQTKLFALYYGAGWCGPCHLFTPKLEEFYREMKPKYPDAFEVVFMSHDESANAMEKYMSELAMPWPAVRFSAIKGNQALNKYCGPGIPCLVLVNEKGEVLSDSFEGKTYLGPYKVMDDLKKMLANGSSAVATGPAAAAASAVAAATATPAKSTAKSPSGTNWDEAFKKKP